MERFSGHRARGLRNGAGLSRPDLASLIGCSTESVKAWETGTSTPSPTSLTALARALRVPEADLEQVHEDPTRDYVDAVLHDAPPLPPEALEAAARVLRRTRGEADRVPAA